MGNSPVTGEFPAQRPVTWSFDVFVDLCLNKRLSKQLGGWWFNTPSRPLWRHCNVAGLDSFNRWPAMPICGLIAVRGIMCWTKFVPRIVPLTTMWLPSSTIFYVSMLLMVCWKHKLDCKIYDGKRIYITLLLVNDYYWSHTNAKGYMLIVCFKFSSWFQFFALFLLFIKTSVTLAQQNVSVPPFTNMV